MSSQKVNRICGVAPVIMSLAAFLLVFAAVVAGWAKGQTDEGSAAHIFQLLIAGQVPVIFVFVVTSDWRRYLRTLSFLAIQVLSIAVALMPVWYFRL